MIHLFFATIQEASTLIYGLTKKRSLKYLVYTGDTYNVIISGIGLLSMTEVLSSYLQQSFSKNDIFINAGIAGSCNSDIKIGEVVKIGSYKYHDYASNLYHGSKKNFLTQLYPVIKSDDGYTLSSSMHPVWHEQEKRLLQNQKIDLIDMEGYSFATICQKYNLNYSAYKVVSDFASKNSESVFQHNKKKAIMNLTATLNEIIGKIS